MAIPSIYWAQRSARAQAALTEKSAKEVDKQLIKYFNNAMKNVVAEFEATYNKYLLSIEKGREPTPADLYKLDKYWQMQGQIRKELEKLGDRQHILFSNRFVEHYAGIYRAVAIKDDLFFGEIDVANAKQMINQIWCADGKTWSSRIWTNTEKLQEALNDNLINCVLTGKDSTHLKKLLMDEFGVAFRRADRIVRTELAHIQTQAARQRYLDSGVSEVEVWADKDERRCDVCGKLHMKRFSIYEPMPVPAHSNCRCSIIPVVEVD